MKYKYLIGITIIFSVLYFNSCNELECISGDMGDLEECIELDLEVIDNNSNGVNNYPVRIEVYFTDCLKNKTKIDEDNDVTIDGNYRRIIDVTVSSREDLITIYMYIGTGDAQFEQVREIVYDEFVYYDELSNCFEIYEKWII